MAGGLKGGEAMASVLNGIARKVSARKSLRVGFLETARYPDGTSVAQVAFWNEYGTKTAPARPFFRNMISEKKGTWGNDLAKILPAVGYDEARAFNLMGKRISDQLRRSIIDITAPQLAPITLMIRKIRTENGDDGKRRFGVDEPTTLAMVLEAAERVDAGESTAGVSTKPLIYTNVLLTSIAYDMEGEV